MSVLHLQFTRPDGETEVYHLKGVREYKIGRGSVCEIRILDMKMSRQHCQVLEREDGWYLEDLGSTNGAKVNGVKIDGSIRLVPGTAISIGLSELLVKNINGSLELDADDLVDDNLDDPAVDRALAPDEAHMETASLHRFPAVMAQDEVPEVEDDVPIALEDSDWDAEPQQDHTGEMDVNPLIAKAKAMTEPDPEPQPAAKRPRRSGSASLMDENASASLLEDPGPAPAAEQMVDGTAADRPKYTSTQHYIKLLGRRVGPLSRAEARRLKAMELKGDLTDDVIDSLPSA